MKQIFFGLLVFIFSFSFYMPTANAQFSQYTARFIGGTTGGPRDICGAGAILNFNSNQKFNPFVLDGNAIWLTGFTDSNLSFREFTPGACTIGKLLPGLYSTNILGCVDLRPRLLPIIQTIGTSGALCLGI